MSIENIVDGIKQSSTTPCSSLEKVNRMDVSQADDCQNTVCGTCTTAIGCSTKAFGDCSAAEGNSTKAYGNSSHAEGNSSAAYGDSSHAEGCTTAAYGTCSHTEGYATNAYADGSHAEGYNTKARGLRSHAEGINTEAFGEGSHAQGYQTRADGYASFADGSSSIARSSYAHAEGYATTAANTYAHAEGYSTQANGFIAHSEGQYTQANGYSSHAEGYYTTAKVDYTHTEGNNTSANGYYAHAEGNYTKADGYSSHAEGSSTTASGSYAHSEGVNTVASANYSHAEGVGTSTKGFVGSHIMGIYGDADTAYSWFLGGGSSDTDRSLAAKILYTGDAFIKNSWNAGGNGYAEMFRSEGQMIEAGYFVTLNYDIVQPVTSLDDYVLGVTTSVPGFVAGNLTMQSSAFGFNGTPVLAAGEKQTIAEIRDSEGNIRIAGSEIDIPVPAKQVSESKAALQYSASGIYWTAVTLVGQVVVNDDGTCQANHYCMPNENGIATDAREGYRVMKRISDSQIIILLR